MQPRGMPADPDARPAVDVVIVTYRSVRDIDTCLDAVGDALADVPGSRVIVVDNDSRDGIADVVNAGPHQVRFVQREVNDGFAAGCHAGAAVSSARRLLFLNPDVIIHAGAVRTLLAAADDHPEAGVIGGRCVDRNGNLDPRSWWGRPTLWSSLCFAVGASSILPGSRIFDPESSQGWDGRDREVPVVSGALMLVERQLWDRLGGFDRDFFLYGEDADLCLRARAAGFSPRVCGAAVFAHQVGASSGESNRLPLVLRGKVTTYLKNLPQPTGRMAAGLLVAGTGMRAGLRGLAGLRRPMKPDRPVWSPVRPRMTTPQWREAWHRRGEWRHGW